MIVKVDAPNQKYKKNYDLRGLSLLIAYILDKTRNVLRKWRSTTCVWVSHLFDWTCRGTVFPVMRWLKIQHVCNQPGNVRSIVYLHVFKLSKVKLLGSLGSSKIHRLSLWKSLSDVEWSLWSTKSANPATKAWPKGLEGSCCRNTGTGRLPMAVVQVTQATNFMC